MSIKIATPVSHLFSSASFASKAAAVSDCLEYRDASPNCLFQNKEELFHSELQIIHTWSEHQKEELFIKLKKLKSLKLVSFHMASCYENCGIKNGMFIPTGQMLTIDQMLANASNNICLVRDSVGMETSICIENNNFFSTGAYDTVTDADFISRIVNEEKIEFLLDIAHAKITAHNRNILFDKYLVNLPIDKTIQVHLSHCGIRPQDGTAIDIHDELTEEDFGEFLGITSRFKPQYATIEYYKDEGVLIKSIQQLRNVLNTKG